MKAQAGKGGAKRKTSFPPLPPRAKFNSAKPTGGVGKGGGKGKPANKRKK